MPRTSCGAPMAFGCSRWTTAGAIFTAVEHWNAECVGWHVCKRGDRFAAPQPISMGLAGLYGSTAIGASGAGLADGSRLPVSVGPLHQPDQVLGHPAVLRLRRRAPDRRAERFDRTLKEQIAMVASTAIAELREPSATSSNSTMQWIVEKNGLSPAQARQAFAANLNLARRVRLGSCVQGTGCANVLTAAWPIAINVMVACRPTSGTTSSLPEGTYTGISGRVLARTPRRNRCPEPNKLLTPCESGRPGECNLLPSLPTSLRHQQPLEFL